jgi:hypothetical protein
MAAISCLAAVVKITTLYPFLIAAIGVVGYQVLPRGGPLGGSGWARRGLWIIACAGLPAIAVVTWTHATDRAKKRSTMGAHITTTTNLMKKWNFGTVEQRLSAETWDVLASRTDLPLGGRLTFAVAALGLIMARRRVAEVTVCLLLYSAGILTFTNLFYVHEYYYFANNIFLIAAAGFAIVAMLEAGPPLRNGAIGGLVLLLGSMVADYNRVYRPVQAYNHTELQRLGTAIRDRTEPDDIVVLLGVDWSPEVPYYSGRRALCLAKWTAPGRIGKCLSSLKPYRIGAVLILPPAQTPIPCVKVLDLLRRQGFEPQAALVDAPFQLLVRADRAAAAGGLGGD